MYAVTFTQGQIHLLNMASHIKTKKTLDLLKEQLSKFYAALVDSEMDELWDSGKWNEQKLRDLRGSHFRTQYKQICGTDLLLLIRIVSFKLSVITADPDDNKFVDCAFAAGADVIVTEDSHFNVLKTLPFPYINIINLDDFLEKVTSAH